MSIGRNLGIEIWLSEQNTALIIDYPLLLYSKKSHPGEIDPYGLI